MKKLRLIYVAVCMCVVFLSCGPSPQQHAVTHLSWTLEGDTLSTLVSDTAMVSFGSISHVLTTPEENLILFDQLNQRVLLADSAGRLLRSLRSFGRGPGEFINVRELGLTGRSDPFLYLLDETNTKVVLLDEELSISGEFSLEYPILGASDSFYLDANTDELLVLAKLYEQSGRGDCLFHRISLAEERLTGCQGEYARLSYASSELFDLLTQAHAGSLTRWKDQIIYSPKIYDGRLYTYDVTQQEMNYTGTIPGYRQRQEMLLEEAEPPQYTLSYRGERYSGRFNGESVGLFIYQENLVHFTKLANEEGGMRFGAEIHSGNSDSLLYVTFLDSGQVDISNINVLHLSPRGILYYQYTTDRSRVFQANLSGLFTNNP